MYLLWFYKVWFFLIKRNFAERYDKDKIKKLMDRVPRILLGEGVAEVWILIILLYSVGHRSYLSISPLAFFLCNAGAYIYLGCALLAVRVLEDKMMNRENILVQAAKKKLSPETVVFGNILKLGNILLVPIIFGLVSSALQINFIYLVVYTIVALGYYFFLTRKFTSYKSLLDTC